MMARPAGDPSWPAWARLAAYLLATVAACPEPRAADDDVVAEAEPAGDGPRQPHMLDLSMNFDANLFEQRGNSWVVRGGGIVARDAGGNVVIDGDPRGRVRGRSPGGDPGPASLAQTRGRELGLKRLERIESACGITADQRRRLMLAMESDIRRFAADVETIRNKYAGRQINMSEPAGQKEWHAFQQDVRRCRDLLRDLFEEGSLFATVLASILAQGQRDCLAAETAARRSFHWRAMVLEAVARLDDSLGLDEQQHDAIVTELLAHEPPLRTDADSLGRDDPNLRRNLVLMVLAAADARRVRASVSEQQWRTLSLLMNQGRAMRSWIEQQGVLEEKP